MFSFTDLIIIIEVLLLFEYHDIYHTLPTYTLPYYLVVVMYFISFVMILLTESSFRTHMRKTLRRTSWKGRKSQKENRKSRRLPRSPRLQKSQKRRVLKGMYTIHIVHRILYIVHYVHCTFYTVHCTSLLAP